jgi:hypothetical protein
VEGLASFIADRTKAEVIAWLEDLIGGRLCKLTYQPIDSDGKATAPSVQWFRETCKILQDPDYGVQVTTAMIASSVREDLQELPIAIAYYAMDHFSVRTNARIFDDRQAIIDVVQQWRAGTSPLLILAGLGRNVSLRKVCQAAQQAGPKLAPECALVVIGLSVEYFSAVTLAPNLTSDQLDDIVKRVLAGRKLSCEIAIAFDPLQAAPTATDSCKNPDSADLSKLPSAVKTYADLLNVAQREYSTYEPRVRQLLQAISALEVDLKAFKNSASDDTLRAVLVGLQQTVGAGAAIVQADDKTIQSGLSGAVALVAMYSHILAKDYTAAGTDLVTATRDFGVPIPESVKKYLAFVIDLASAKTSDDVQASIDRVAAAVGGWKLKHQHMTLSVSAYAGVIGGYETPQTSLVSNAATTKPSGGWAAGLFAPVGLDLSGPIGKGTLSQGFFLSVLDVGQLTWARLSNASEDNDMSKADVASNTSFAQVLSPGLYYHLGLGHSPFTVGIGASYAPALRKYTITTATGGVETDSLSTLRVGMFLSIDVTILPIWAHEGD